MTGSISRKLYRQFLLLYPEPFRREFGDEMLSVFEECRAAQGFWRLLADVVLSAASQEICYLSTPLPKSAPFYSEIASSPNLARILAVAVLGAALIPGVLVGGKPKAPESWMAVRQEVRFWFPTGVVVVERKPNAPESWRVLPPELPICSPTCADRPEQTSQAASTNPASRQLKDWLAAYDDPDWDAYLVFVQKHFAFQPEPMLRNPAFRNMTGGFDLKKIEAETTAQVTAVVQERDSNQMARIIIEVEPAEPHRIVRLHPQPIPLAHLPEKELWIRTREYVEELVSADKFAGAYSWRRMASPSSRKRTAWPIGSDTSRILYILDSVRPQWEKCSQESPRSSSSRRENSNWMTQLENT